jgi:hypothetical protein
MEDVGYAGWTWCIQSNGRVPIRDQATHLRDLRDAYDPSLSGADVLEAVVAAQLMMIDVEGANANDARLPNGGDSMREQPSIGPARILSWSGTLRSPSCGCWDSASNRTARPRHRPVYP